MSKENATTPSTKTPSPVMKSPVRSAPVLTAVVQPTVTTTTTTTAAATCSIEPGVGTEAVSDRELAPYQECLAMSTEPMAPVPPPFGPRYRHSEWKACCPFF